MQENMSSKLMADLVGGIFMCGVLSTLRKQPAFCDAATGFPRNDVWETSAEIPYWWRITTQVWVVLLIGRAA